MGIDHSRSRAVVFTETPDQVDYAKLQQGWAQAAAAGCAVTLHNVCLECPSITVVPPTLIGEGGNVIFEHEPWCPVLAHHEGRQLTPAQKRRHRRYMDGR